MCQQGEAERLYLVAAERDERERRRKLCNEVMQLRPEALRATLLAYIDEAGVDVVGHLAARIRDAR